MLFISRRPTVLVAAFLLLAVACKKDDRKELEGPVPSAEFTVSLNTSQFPVVATFTNTSTDGFLYQWDFGDGSALASGQTVTHTYVLPRTYEVRLVVAGRGGTGTSPAKEVTIPSICSNAKFQGLTGCSSAGWTYSDQPGAIKYFAPDGVTVDSVAASPLSECQGDDVFTFTSAFGYSYDPGVNCTPGRNLAGSYSFTFKEVNGVSSISLQGKGAFVGRPDSVRNKTYEIVEATSSILRLQGTLPSGHIVQVTLVPPAPPLVRTERLLTNNSSRTWVLDNTQAATIVVGTEAQPATYYAGGALGSLPPCQADDEYTFNTMRTLRYDAKAETFVAGSFSCQAPRSYTTSYTFGQAAGAGVAQLVLRAPSPTVVPFIGTTDAAPDLIYRIISINSREMVLRGGGPTALSVFTMKFRVK